LHQGGEEEGEGDSVVNLGEDERVGLRREVAGLKGEIVK
jgi:hypothetical protein